MIKRWRLQNCSCNKIEMLTQVSAGIDGNLSGSMLTKWPFQARGKSSWCASIDSKVRRDAYPDWKSYDYDMSTTRIFSVKPI